MRSGRCSATSTRIKAEKPGYGKVCGVVVDHRSGDAGIVESTDGGSSWSKPLRLPEGFSGVSALTWLEYDPTREVLYVLKLGSELFKLQRDK